MPYILIAALASATLQDPVGGRHRIEIMTPNSGETCTFAIESKGGIGRSVSLWQNDVTHRKIANRYELVDPARWADEIERLHGPSAYRMVAVGACRATHIMVYADTPAAADLGKIDNVSDIRSQRCTLATMMADNRRHNASLSLPTGITVVFALLKEEPSGHYESVLTHYWDRQVPEMLVAADQPCPPPPDQLPPVPPAAR